MGVEEVGWPAPLINAGRLSPMNTIEATIAYGAMALTPYANTWTLPLTHPAPYIEFVPGPQFKVEGDKLVFQNQLPGTPIEGSKLTTETKELVPCFAAVLPACPGHWRTNLTEWVYRSGRWAVEAPVGSTNVMVSTNMVLPSSTTTNLSTNVFTTTPDTRTLRLEKEALEKQVEFWKAKALEAVR